LSPLQHQVCQFHVRRWVDKALQHELKQTLPEEWLGMADEVHQILSDLPIEGDKRLLTLYRQLPQMHSHQGGSELSPVEKLRNLILRLSNH